MINLIAFLAVIEVLVSSILLMNVLGRRFDVVTYVLGLLTIFLVTIPALAYLSGALGFGLAETIALLTLLPLLALLILHFAKRVRLGTFPRIEVGEVGRLILLGAVDTVSGIGPLWPTFYPTSQGDTAHQYSYVQFLYRYSQLPSSTDFYPLIHHGLYSLGSGFSYPLGMHIVIAIMAKASGIPAIVLLDLLTLVSGMITSVAVYRLALYYRNTDFALISGVLSFIGVPLALSLYAGSLTTVWGIMFLALFCLFLHDFEQKPELTRLPLVIASVVGAALYYPFYLPATVLGFILVVILVSSKRIALVASLAVLIGSVGSLALYTLGTYASYGTLITQELWPGIWGSRELFIFASLCCALIFILARSKFIEHAIPAPTVTAATMTCIVMATLPLLAVLLQDPTTITCFLPCLYFFVPGYSFGLNFGLTLFVALSCLLLCRLKKNLAILAVILFNFGFLVIYYWSNEWYYVSKQIFAIAVIVPVLLVPLIDHARALVGAVTARGLRRSTRFRNTLLGVCLLSVIAVGLVGQGYVAAMQQTSLRPAVYPGEIEAGEWLRANADLYFPCLNYEYFVTMDVLRAEFFEVASEHQFNMNHIGSSVPPYPLSYTFDDWLEFARPGDILVGDMSYPNAIPQGLDSLPLRTPVVVGSGYIEILYVSPPVIIVRYLGTSPIAGNFTCTAGWSTTYGRQPIYATTTNTTTTTLNMLSGQNKNNRYN